MKRFFLYVSIAFIAAAILSFVLRANMIYVFAVCAAVTVICIVLIARFKVKFLYFILIIFVLLPIFLVYCNLTSENKAYIQKSLNGKECKFSGTILSVSMISGRKFPVYTIKTDAVKLKNSPQNIKIKLTSYNDRVYKTGDRISASVKFSKPKDYVYEYYSDGIYLAGTLYNSKLIEHKPMPASTLAFDIKQGIVSFYSSELSPDISGIPIGMLTGDKTYISDEFYTVLVKTGLVHVMAVSGLHISIICTFVLRIFKMLKLGNKPVAIIGFVIIIMLMFIAGFTGSVMRAGFMYMVVLLAQLFSRRADALNSLGAAVSVLSIVNPFTIFSTSFMMSALGTLGILLFSEPLYNIFKIKRVFIIKPITAIINYFINVFCVSLCASLMIVPVCLYKFSYMSVIGPFVNIAAAPIVCICIILSLLSPIFCVIPGLEPIVTKFSAVFVEVFKNIIVFFSNYKYAVLYKEPLISAAIAIMFVLMIVLMILFRYKLSVKAGIIVFAIALFQIMAIYQTDNYSKHIAFTFYNAKDKACVLVESGNDAVVLTDARSGAAYSEIKEKLNSRIDNVNLYIVALNKTKTTFRTAESSLKEFYVHNIYAYSDDSKLKSIKLNNGVKLKFQKSEGTYNVLVSAKGKKILIDNSGTASAYADCIFTTNPVLCYKKYKNKIKYFVLGDKSAVGYINSHNGYALCIEGSVGMFIDSNNKLKLSE